MPSRSPSRPWRVLIGGVALSTAVAGVVALGGSASASPSGGGHGFRAIHKALPKPSASDGEGGNGTDSLKASLPKKGSYTFLLKLSATSTASRFNAVRATGTKAQAKSAARSQLATVAAAQTRVEHQFGKLEGGATVLYRTHAAMAGIAVRTNVANADALKGLTGVTAVYPIAPKKPDTSYAVPFQGAPTAWEGDGSGQNLGQGVTVADIDTGLDYTHADFGGPGTTEAYDAAKAADTTAPDPDSYDPDKFDATDSYDLAGDDYNADPTGGTPGEMPYQPVPHPDPNPLDCSAAGGGDGHGSHTAGTIAGYGVTKAGETYDGAYNSTTVNTDNADDWQIGPGMAPKAKLISYRVFGCTGATDLVSAAIDKAMDPNGDGDTSDHADVINISIGSDFGSPDDGDAMEADLAAKAGATLAISSGNSYDEYDVGGSPGSAQRAITVAASEDAQSITDAASYTIAGGAPAEASIVRSDAYDWTTKPDLSGSVVALTGSDAEKAACAPLTTTDKGRVAGKIVFVDWDEAAVDAGDPDTGCGSVARGSELSAAGAAGFIFGSNETVLSIGITGSDAIPGVLMAEPDSDEIRTALGASKAVEVTGTSTASKTVTETADNDKLASFSSRGLRGSGDLKPDVAAVGATVFSVLPGSGSKGQDMSGTSMAAPMVTGLAALIRGKHADWTPEQVKADIMNTADKNVYVDGSADPSAGRYAPMRVGAGRIDAASALSNGVLAYVTDDPGAVSASFGPLEVTSPLTATKTIKVQNTGTTAATYATGFDQITAVPGVHYSVSPATVSVAAGQSADVTLTLSIPDPKALAETTSFDPTHGNVDAASGAPVDTIAEASGNVTLTPTSGSAPALRVPAYAAPRPASQMTQSSQAVLGAGGTGKLALSGTDIGYDQPGEAISSLAEGFELQATSPAQPACSTTVVQDCVSIPSERGADLAYVGTTSDYPLFDAGGDSDPTDDSFAYFAVTTHGPHSTIANKVEFDIYIDADGDGVPDLMAINTRLGTGDFFVEEVYKLVDGAPDTTDGPVDVEPLTGLLFGGDHVLDTAVYDSDVAVFPVSNGLLAAYGAKPGQPIRYGIASFSSSSNDEIDEVGFSRVGVTIPAYPFEPGLVVSQDGGGPLLQDKAGASVDVARNATSYAAEGGKGLLMIHFHNKVGAKAQVVPVVANGSLTVSADPASLVRGTPTTLTVAVAHGSSAPVPTGTVQVSVGGQQVGTVTLDAAGTATLRYTPTAPGALAVSAAYSGDGNYAATTATATLQVQKAAAKLSVKAKKKVRRGATLKVTVKVATVGGIAPTGKVTLASGKTKLGTAKLKGGKAVVKVKATKRGKLRLKASYAGDATYLAGKSKALVVQVR